MKRYEIVVPGKPGLTLATSDQARSAEIAEFYKSIFNVSLIKLQFRELVETGPADPQARIAELEKEVADLRGLLTEAIEKLEAVEPKPPAEGTTRVFPRTNRGHWTINQVQERWEDDLEKSEKGTIKDRCPCCDKNMQIYDRRPHKSMAIGLMVLAVYLKKNDLEYAHLNDVFRGLDNGYRGDLGKFLFHGFVKQKPGQKGDGNPDTGYWGITPEGYEFLDGKRGFPAHTIEYQSKVLGSSEKTQLFSEITNNFNYDRDIRGIYEGSTEAVEDASVVKRESADPAP